MSEKKNFTENQILDLGKISPVEKGGISHSILVALEKDLKGKDIKDIENFYKNNISLDAQKAILKISMEVEKNQIPENRKKKGNYKIVYKTDNIDLGKLKKTEEKPKEEVKVENPKVESTKTIENSKTEITPTSTFEQNIATPVIEEKVDETPTIIIEEAKNSTPITKDIPAPMAVPINPTETENKTEIVLLNEEEAKQTILEILNTKNVDLDGINLLWLKGETKSRENLAQSFVNKLKEEQGGKLIFSKEQIQTIFNTFIEEKEDLNETQTTKKVESLSSYLNEKYSLKAAETYSNWIEQETKNSENLKNELNEKINNLNNKKSKLEADYLDISNTYKKLEDSNDYMEKLIPILNGIGLNSNGLTKEDSDKITNFKDKANENLGTFRENFLQATNIYKSIENEKESKKIILTTTETPVKPEEKKAPAENTPAKPVQANDNKTDSPVSGTEQEQKNNDKKIITNEEFLDLFKELDLDFDGIGVNEGNARLFFINEFKDYVLRNEKSFNYDYDDIKGALYSTYNNKEDINFGIDNNNQKEIEKLYNNLKISKENTNQKNRKVLELSPMQ